MSFEEQITELESLIKRLEDSNTGLEECIQLYSQGIILAKSCMDHLNSGKEKIQSLQKEMSDLFNGNEEV